MTLVLLLSLLTVATDVTCSRTLTVPRGIERTVLRLGAGLAVTYGDEARLTNVAQILEGDLGSAQISDARILVDGERTGTAFGRIVCSTATLGLFVADRSRPGDSVELRYALQTRGLAINRRVTVTEGQIDSRASFACALGPQGRCKAVWFRAVATESEAGTTIRLTATVRANTGICPGRSESRCRLVNRYARHQIEQQLDDTLRGVAHDGRTVAAAGHDALRHLARSFVDNILERWTR